MISSGLAIAMAITSPAGDGISPDWPTGAVAISPLSLIRAKMPDHPHTGGR